MAHAASAGGSSADSLLGPVVASGFSSSAAAGITVLLLVPVRLASLPGQSVRLVIALALRLTSCSLKSRCYEMSDATKSVVRNCVRVLTIVSLDR